MKNNFITRWWRAIDQQVIIALSFLISFSLILVTTTSLAMAERVGLSDNYFSSRQVIYLIVAALFLLIFSSMGKKPIKRFAIIGFLFSIVMLILLKIFGYEIKGATRWIRIAGFSYQPSEFMKPFFIIVTGWILSLRYEDDFPSFRVCIALYLTVASLLIIQPDFGMLILVTMIFGIQLFVAGLEMIWIISSVLAGGLGIMMAYFFLPHVTTRINSFLNPSHSENYQISKSILAFEHGGLYGTGPGEGSVKQHIPDSHTDFIFAVAGEEFGAIICIMIVCLFAFIVIKMLIRVSKENDKFVQLASVGIISQFGLQATINICVTLNLLPTKGMTLPFVSYGGSSTLAVAMGMGMLLGLTKEATSLVKYRITA